MRITFCGAAQTVTGSQHLVEVNGRRILLDCGLYQGPRREAIKRNTYFHFDPKRLDCVILSHAHMDHSGNLPTLVRAGFRGPIYCTSATADVAAVMLMDSAKIQLEDAEFLNKRKRRHGEPITLPLYDLDDAERAIKQLESRKYFSSFEPVRGVHVTFWDAGHLLGSAITQIDIEQLGQAAPTRLVFTGDLGRRKLPILRDPMTVKDVHILISESTYGDRIHDQVSETRDELKAIIAKVIERRGKIIVPAFALGRTQNIVYYLNRLFLDGKLPRVPIYVDSPLSVKVTDVYRDHPECYDTDTGRLLRDDPDVFGFFGLTYISAAEESKRLNRLDGPYVVIASSGMCEAGRVLHHLRYSVSDPRNAVIIVGYQAGDTLGRRIAERQPRLKIMDDWFDLKADVFLLDGLSSHADRNDFQWWFESIGTPVEHAFLVHGEPVAMTALATLVQPFVKNRVHAPAMYETVEL
jgi:metallo-beta-lactamase family protein